MLTQFAPRIWLADGPTVTAALGFAYPTRMAVVQLHDGGLWVWSPVALEAGLRRAIQALGPVAHLVAPNTLHHVFLRDWIAAWPGARLHGPAALAAKRPDLGAVHPLRDAPPQAWAGQIDQVVLPANAITTEAVFHHRASRSVLVCDLLQQLPAGWYRGWRGLVARADLMTGPEPQVPRKFRLAFRDRAVLRAALARVVAWPAERVVIAHGAPVASGGADLLRRAFAFAAVPPPAGDARAPGC